MSELNIEDCEEVIASAESSLVQMLALQLKNELAKNTALTSQLESVVAENAALKQSELEYDATCREEFGSDWVTELTETPATDAFLAEVRASGVEMLAEHLSGMSISASETSVREFAAQLRQGGAA